MWCGAVWLFIYRFSCRGEGRERERGLVAGAIDHHYPSILRATFLTRDDFPRAYFLIAIRTHSLDKVTISGEVTRAHATATRLEGLHPRHYQLRKRNIRNHEPYHYTIDITRIAWFIDGTRSSLPTQTIPS